MGWIEDAKAKGQIRSGTYGHHSKAQMRKDAKGKGIKAKRARLAETFATLRARGHKALHGG